MAAESAEATIRDMGTGASLGRLARATREEGGSGLHLLYQLAAQGDVGTAEDVRHVPGHFQVVLAIHTGDLEKGERFVLSECLLPHTDLTAPPPA